MIAGAPIAVLPLATNFPITSDDAGFSEAKDFYVPGSASAKDNHVGSDAKDNYTPGGAAKDNS